jgi:hypothetical protein
MGEPLSLLRDRSYDIVCTSRSFTSKFQLNVSNCVFHLEKAMRRYFHTFLKIICKRTEASLKTANYNCCQCFALVFELCGLKIGQPATVSSSPSSLKRSEVAEAGKVGRGPGLYRLRIEPRLCI